MTKLPEQASAGSRERVTALAEEQAALRRVATLVAEGVSSEELFTAVAEEVARVLGVSSVTLGRHEGDDWLVLASLNDPGFPVGSLWPRSAPSIGKMVFETGLPARIDDYSTLQGVAAATNRAFAVSSTVAAPVVVDGKVWGVMSVHTIEPKAKLPADTEDRLNGFTRLVAIAIANAKNRAELTLRADEQAALQRVATLVARGASPERVFAAVANEVTGLFHSDLGEVVRFEDDGTVTVLGTTQGPHAPGNLVRPPVGERIMPDPGYGMYQVRQTGCSARFDTDDPSGADMPHFVRLLGIRSVVASPIVVEGKLWGAVTTVSLDRPLGPRVEHRLNEFTGLVATAVANTQSREHVAALAEQQAALRRVATLVAQGTTPAELFSAVAEEVANVMGIPVVALDRYEGDGTFTIVGIAGETVFTVGDRYQVVEDGVSGMILAARSPVRVEDYSGLCGPLGDALREDSMTSTLGVPVVVDGRIWGFLVAGGRPGRPVPVGTEERLAEFTELIATAVSNATTRSELLESRARLVSAADETRRRIERDLHDGIQQRLIRLAFALRTSERQLPEEPPEIRKSLAAAAAELSDVLVELREISRGIHPAVLAQGGLGPALRTLARRSTCPVQVVAGSEKRLAEPVEVAAYYVAAEALANVAKHAHATRALVDFNVMDGILTLQVQDDGVGGADARRGSGLIGIADRVQALGGTIEVESPAGFGTTLIARLPASDEQDAPLAGDG